MVFCNNQLGIVYFFIADGSRVRLECAFHELEETNVIGSFFFRIFAEKLSE